MSTKRPSVGMGVIVIRDGKVLLGLRHGAHGAETWSLPGGHLEWHESFDDAVRREVKEETGLELGAIERIDFTNDPMPKEGKHYVTLFFLSRNPHGEVELREPDKCREWRWCSWDDLPRPLFRPLENFIATGWQP